MKHKWFFYSCVTGLVGSILGALVCALWDEMVWSKYFVTSGIGYLFLVIADSLYLWIKAVVDD